NSRPQAPWPRRPRPRSSHRTAERLALAARPGIAAGASLRRRAATAGPWRRQPDCRRLTGPGPGQPAAPDTNATAEPARSRPGRASGRLLLGDALEVHRDQLGDAGLLHGDSVEPVGDLHGSLVVGDDDELRS